MCCTRSGHSAAMQCVERAVVTACWPRAIPWRKATCDTANIAAKASLNQPEQVGTPVGCWAAAARQPPAASAPHFNEQLPAGCWLLVPTPPGHSRAATEAAEVPPPLRMCADTLCRCQRL